MADRIETEVLIAGGGMVGLSLAVALADAGLSVMVVDRLDPSAMREEAFDGRSSAIARGSRQALTVLGLWDGMADAASPILDIRISDGLPGAARRGGASPLYLHFSHSDVPDNVPGDGGPLGHIVENTAIRRACLARAAALPGLDLRAPGELVSVTRGAAGVAARLDDGTAVTARLLVAADGRASAQRQAAGIAVTEVGYGQTGIVATVAHEFPHHGVAHEHFLPSGPFALLPMTDAQDGEGRPVHRSSLVWTERSALVPAMLALDDDGFAGELQRRFGDSLGRLSLWSHRRWSYPLSLLHAERYIDRRFALVGDAAHGIHPIAGQGLNLGLRDVAALAEAVVDARRLGLDIGSATVLQRYQRWRRFDNMALIAATDSLNRLFSTDLPPVRLLRDLGLAAVNRMPPLKRFFMRHAMGLVGDLPRLVKGETL
ncbi:UbiH/UbiF/VisC/COQ6 family ubiquinone biosynthesis hydroxylase [Pelagibius litoralis]|uniref:UbiH/UbiF/VisC/COQ6 family ubiquinone biosynthesis hydroxylase n=1 Tax=Pelagibius litoralis TaxID=374515 RepID=A0A967KCR2_9PROT|nr:UbiH/UbiF/VisC/COQ6 family ubiquinone biosynthesis hydroxylase [Pelagibius litoralis]NIA71009.1 UbiH/UbiF/VisC/COQ6 family ubiquinone biosynthesis hydroxylase [Pelagibius litoralis]